MRGELAGAAAAVWDAAFAGRKKTSQSAAAPKSTERIITCEYDVESVCVAGR